MGGRIMTELEETVTALKTLFDKVDELQKINIRDILKPEIYTRYKKDASGSI